MELFTEVKAIAEKLYKDISGEARADLEKALADVEAEVSKIEDMVQTAAADVKAAVVAASPAIQAAVEAELEKLVTSLLGLFEKSE
jgi:molecular chaperone GrpE (heat shock protein)